MDRYAGFCITNLGELVVETNQAHVGTTCRSSHAWGGQKCTAKYRIRYEISFLTRRMLFACLRTDQ